MLTSVSLVAAIAMNLPSRSSGSNSRFSQAIEPSAASSANRLAGVRGDEHDLAVAGEQALDLLEADVAAADDQALAAGQPQAGDVEGGLEHPAHAGLVAESPAELADALLAWVALGGHCGKA